MRARVHIAIPLTLWFAAVAGGSMEVRSQEIGSKGEGHSLDYWRRSPIVEGRKQRRLVVEGTAVSFQQLA
jgi:hypothetical protein